MYKRAEPHQSADTGKDTGTRRFPCTTVAAAVTVVPILSDAGAANSSASTCGLSSTWNQDRSGADQLREAASAARAFGSIPTRAHPVKPPASGAAAGLLPEFPVSGSSTPSVRDAAKVPAWAAM